MGLHELAFRTPLLCGPRVMVRMTRHVFAPDRRAPTLRVLLSQYLLYATIGDEPQHRH
jgi:hypothetical protein